MQREMIGIQASDKAQFDSQPAIEGELQQLIPQGGTQHQCDNGRRPGDAQPQPFYHDAELALQYRSVGLGFFVGLGIVYEQPHNVEHAGKPGDNEDNMQCFQIQVHVITDKLRPKIVYRFLRAMFSWRLSMVPARSCRG